MCACLIVCQARSKQFWGGTALEMGVVNSLWVWFVYTLVTRIFITIDCYIND